MPPTPLRSSPSLLVPVAVLAAVAVAAAPAHGSRDAEVVSRPEQHVTDGAASTVDRPVPLATVSEPGSAERK